MITRLTPTGKETFVCSHCNFSGKFVTGARARLAHHEHNAACAGIIHKPKSEATAGPTGTEAAVCADIARRQQLGLAKYGTTVAANPLPLRDWLQHAYEECLDQAIYLRRALDVLPR